MACQLELHDFTAENFYHLHALRWQLANVEEGENSSSTPLY